jgi:flagellar motor switch protein FliM
MAEETEVKQQQDEGLAEWENMIDGGEESSEMNQSAIDDLFGSAVEDTREKKGVELLLDKALQSYVRLPMLENIYERLSRALSNSLRNFTSDTVDVDLKNNYSQRFGDYMNTVPMPSMISIFKAVELDNYGLIVFDSSIIYSFIDILFGGRKVPPSLRVEGRPFTAIEQNIVKNITEIILNDLRTSFEPVHPVTYQLDRIETNSRFAMIVRPEDVANILHLEILMEDRKGAIYIVLPYVTIDPIKKVLTKSYIGERGNKDPAWINHMEREIKKADVCLEVVLSGIDSKLRDAARLEVGKTIVLDKLADVNWDLKINGIRIGECKPGKIDDKVSVKLVTDGIEIKKN